MQLWAGYCHSRDLDCSSLKANVLRLLSPTVSCKVPDTAFLEYSSAHLPHPTPPALDPRVPHTWSDFLERLWRLLLHLISGHDTLVKGVCGRTHGLKHAAHLRYKSPAGDRENGRSQRLTCLILGSPFHTEHCTQAGGDSRRRKKQTGVLLVPGNCYFCQPCLGLWGCLCHQKA